MFMCFIFRNTKLKLYHVYNKTQPGTDLTRFPVMRFPVTKNKARSNQVRLHLALAEQTKCLALCPEILSSIKMKHLSPTERRLVEERSK